MGHLSQLLGSFPLGSLTAARQTSLSCESTADSPQSRMSALTHSAQVFRDLPRPLLPGTTRLPTMPMPVLVGTRSTCPAHLNLPQRRTVVMSARPSFSSIWSEGMSSWALTPQIHLTMERSFRGSRCSSEAFGPHYRGTLPI